MLFILSCRSEWTHGVISFYSEELPLAFLVIFPLLFKILWQTGAKKTVIYQFHYLISMGFSRNSPISSVTEFFGIRMILFPYYAFSIVVSVVLALLSILLLVICVFSIFLLIRGSSAVISSKNQFLVLIFCIVCFSISLISVVSLSCLSSHLF